MSTCLVSASPVLFEGKKMKDFAFGSVVAELLEKLLSEDNLYAYERQTITLKAAPRRGPCRFYTFEINGSEVTLLCIEREYNVSRE